DRQTLRARVLDQDGQPLAGIPLTWSIESSPGSPHTPGATTVSDAAGIATATFDFDVVGRTLIAASYPDVTPVRWQIDTDTLGVLTRGTRTYRSVAAALDAICANAYTTGTPAPLCAFLTETLTTREERGAAVHALSATGLGAQTANSAVLLGNQIETVAERLSALRSGARREALGQIALSFDGGSVSSSLLAAARSAAAARAALSRRIDESFLYLAAGPDAREAATSVASDPVVPKRERPWGFFVNGRLARGDRGDGFEETGYKFETTGVTIGFDRAVGLNGFLGFAFSGIDNSTDFAGAGGKLDTTGLSLTLYGIRETGEHGYVQATATYGTSRYEQARRLQLPVVGPLTARAEFDGNQVGGTLEGGFAWDGPGGTATLFGRGSWLRCEADPFTETGAVVTLPGTGMSADFGLTVDGHTVSSLLGEVGLDLSRVIQTRHALIVPQLNASYLHEFEAERSPIRGRFRGDLAAVAAFDLFSDTPDRDFFNVGASLRFQFLWGSFFVSWDRHFDHGNYTFESFNGGLRFEF
nr:autotransporter domain-containing protein [Thermoanaerobaculia bacterium]